MMEGKGKEFGGRTGPVKRGNPNLKLNLNLNLNLIPVPPEFA